MAPVGNQLKTCDPLLLPDGSQSQNGLIGPHGHIASSLWPFHQGRLSVGILFTGEPGIMVVLPLCQQRQGMPNRTSKSKIQGSQAVRGENKALLQTGAGSVPNSPAIPARTHPPPLSWRDSRQSPPSDSRGFLPPRASFSSSKPLRPTIGSGGSRGFHSIPPGR